MDGCVRASARCGKCGGKFLPVVHAGEVAGLECPQGHRPERYYIDARAFKAGKIYKDTRAVLFDSFRAAHRQLEEMRRQRDAGTFDPSKYATARLKECRFQAEAEKWISYLRAHRSPSYASGVTGWLKNHVGALAGMDVRDVRRSHLYDWIETLRGKGLSPGAVSAYRDYASNFFSWLLDREEIRELPIVPKVDIPYKERPWIGRDAQEAVLAKIAERHRLLFRVLVETGLRPGEVAALQVKDVLEGEIVIEKTVDRTGALRARKAGGRLYRAISLDLTARLKEQARGKTPMAYLFTNRTGKKYRSGGLSAIWKKAAEDAGYRIDLYRGTRTSHASRARKEAETYQRIAAELGNTPGVVKRSYAQDRTGEIVRGTSVGEIRTAEGLEK